MLNVHGTTIEIIQGDSEPIEIELLDNEVPDGTEALLIVRKCGKEYIRKELTVENNKIQVWLKHSDTAHLSSGKYEWGICFPNYRGEDEPYHVSTPWVFTVMEGV